MIQFQLKFNTLSTDRVLRVLVACEYSATVRDAFAARGHDAWSCDLLPCDKGGQHIQGNVLDVLDQGWDLMIAHPPCTYLANSGARWLWEDKSRGMKNKERWLQLEQAATFFRAFIDADIPRICIENPIMLSYGLKAVGRRYDQKIQPYQFGHKETKATCLWLKGLDPLQPTTDYKEETMALPAKIRCRLGYLSPSPDRWKLRSKTYDGIAQAMAQQWG